MTADVLAALPQGVRDRDLAWLKQSAHEPLSGYPGCQWDSAPKVYARLKQAGLVERWEPSNPVHKDRAIITDAGLAALRARAARDA